MSKTIKHILEEDFLVTSADTDFARKLRISSLINMYIQIAWHHAEELGFGISYLHQNNLAWVLSKLHLKIDAYPEWNDTLKLVTWPKGINRLFYLRDLEVNTKSGKQVARATSEWLIIDTKTKRPKLKGPDNDVFNKNKDKHAIASLVENIDTLTGNFELFPLKISYSDIDLNQHLTTTRYIDWMFDTFEMDMHEKFHCTEVVLNFMREIPYGIEVSAKRNSCPDKNCHNFEIIKNNTEQTLFRGKIHFKSIEQPASNI
jgi:medium-chain acyl-[acyl-carrier-protein] hydrolase